MPQAFGSHQNYVQISRRYIPFALAIGLGLGYSLLARFAFGDFNPFDSELLSVAYLVVMPLALGAVTAHFVPTDASKALRYLGTPFLVVMSFMAATLLFHLEGLICLVIVCPLFMVLSVLGAALYGTIHNLLARRRDQHTLAVAFALLPYLLAPLENRFANPDSFRRVENVIDIAAPAPVVWQHIIRVAPIRAAELGPSLLDDIGFPRPVAATLTREGVGGVRHATFERGVEFIETVDDWQPLRRLSFRIAPNTATIPPSTFDEHVTVGGRFFDVLRGTYELRPLGPGRTRLILYSQQRVSTHLNWYAGLWTRYVMSEIQQRILGVLKKRCEASPTPNPSPAGEGSQTLANVGLQ